MADPDTPPYTYSGLTLQPTPWTEVRRQQLGRGVGRRTPALWQSLCLLVKGRSTMGRPISPGVLRSWLCLQLVLQVKAAIEQLQPGTSYNSCLLNLYRDGSHHVSWHSDNEKL